MIDVFIINRDLITWPKAMVNKIKTLTGVGRIFIVDNDSSYEPCLEWYNSDNDITLIKLPSNIGHKCIWEMDIPTHVNANEYIVTDPDLDIDHLPNDVCLYLKHCYDNRPILQKVGLSLEVSDVPNNSIYFVSKWEKFLWSTKSDNDVFYSPVDTTFAYYTTARSKKHVVGGARTKPPYVAKHIPWYYNEDMLRSDSEFLYYLRNASWSCSMKVQSSVVKRILREGAS